MGRLARCYPGDTHFTSTAFMVFIRGPKADAAVGGPGALRTWGIC